MKRSWLIQRLTKPRGSFGPFTDNPFSFGGGLLNGGLSSDAMDLLRPIFGFDYMGAAEFEFGAVPKALQQIAEAAHEKPRKSKLTAFSFEIPLAQVAADWRDKSAPDGSATLYALCHVEHAAEVEARVRQFAAKDHTLKESTRLPATLRPVTEWDGETVGWLELDNGFFFFTDADMWAQTCAVFGVQVEAVTR